MRKKNCTKVQQRSEIAAYSPTQTEYWCEKGYLVLNSRWYVPTSISVWKQGDKTETYPSGHKEGFGYKYEAANVMECLDNGKIQSDIMTWQMSLDLMETLDGVRIDAGIFFPEHDKKMFF
jgi:hypothetical protein